MWDLNHLGGILLKVTKLSASILIIYILFYLQIWGDNHLVLYGSAVIMIFSMLVHCFQVGYLDMSNIPYGIWNNLIIVIYALLTGILIVNDYNTVIGSSVTFASYSLVCIAICYVSSVEKSLDWLLILLIGVASICSLYALVHGYIWEGYGRTLSKTNNPHTYAAVMYLGIFSTVFIQQKSKIKRLIICTVLVSIFFYSIIECGSRKYLLVSTCFIILWICTTLKTRWIEGDTRERIHVLIIGVAVIVIGVYLYREIYMHSSISIRMMNDNDLGDKNRIKNYKKAWEIFLNHPLFGCGYDQFQYLSGTNVHSHSTYAEALADFGIIGCFLYFSPFIYTIRKLYSRVFITDKDVLSLLVLALCIAELFLGAGQIFFMDFYHFLAWTIVFYYAADTSLIKQSITIKNTTNKRTYKYIRYSKN